MKIQNNPFFILRVSCSDDRRKIMSATEEMEFMLDQDVCAEAQNALINPEKRLSAELDWFIDLDDSGISSIRNSIENEAPISSNGLSPLSKLNAALFNFSLPDDDDIPTVGYSILNIDGLYSAVDASDVVSWLNKNRTAAKMPEVQPQAVHQELNKKRESIRQIIMDKLSNLKKEDYIQLVTLLAEKCIDNDNNTGVVIYDVIDQYEVSIQSELETSTDRIERHIERIKSLFSEKAIHDSIQELIQRVQTWDKLAQPLQLKSQASGMPHKISEQIGLKLRGLVLFLHNEKGLSEDALILVDAMQDVFAELGDLAGMFRSDSDSLNDVIKGKAEAAKAEAVLKELQLLKSAAEDIKSYATAAKIDSFISKVIALDEEIKGLGLDSQLQTQLRECLCYMARDVAVTLHNNSSQTEKASFIAEKLKTEFSDVPSLKTKLTEDCNALKQQLVGKQRADNLELLIQEYNKVQQRQTQPHHVQQTQYQTQRKEPRKLKDMASDLFVFCLCLICLLGPLMIPLLVWVINIVIRTIT